MALLKVQFVMLAITVCNQLGAVTGAENLTRQRAAERRKAMIDTLGWLQQFDRGCIARPNIDIATVRFLSLDDVRDLEQEAYVELQCSYAYFALTYLHLINIYISQPMTLVVPAKEELISMTFAKESATMMALVHTNPDHQWKTVKAVIWLFHMFAEKFAYFAETDRSDSSDFTETVNKSVIWPYNAINILLEEFTVTTGCKAYDQVTGLPDNLSYVDKIRNVSTDDRQSVISKLSSNKNRFRIQTEWNEQLGFFPIVDRSAFFVDNLLLGMWRDDGKVMFVLENTFGVQLEWESITLMLDYCYGQATDAITAASLQEYIDELQGFQNQFICVLKAIAIRIVNMFLLQLQHTNNNSVPPYLMGHVERVTRGLQAFVLCVHLFGDQHLKTIIDSMNKLSEAPEKIDKLLEDIQELLKDMSPPDNDFGIHFDKPIIGDESVYEQAKHLAMEFAKDNELNIPEDTENVTVIEVYVGFVRTIANFDAIALFGQLTTSAEFRRFKVLENEEQLKQP